MRLPLFLSLSRIKSPTNPPIQMENKTNTMNKLLFRKSPSPKYK